MSYGLSNSTKDVSSLEMIALCHHWAGRDESAIASANQALSRDPKCFSAIELLGRIYANRSEHETAAKYLRLGLKNFPEPLPAVPRLYFSLLRLVGLIISRFKRVAEKAEREIGDINKARKEWHVWAKKYLAW